MLEDKLYECEDDTLFFKHEDYIFVDGNLYMGDFNHNDFDPSHRSTFRSRGLPHGFVLGDENLKNSIYLKYIGAIQQQNVPQNVNDDRENNEQVRGHLEDSLNVGLYAVFESVETHPILFLSAPVKSIKDKTAS